MKKKRIGILGCGDISAIYLKNLTAANHVEVAACADLVRARATARAEEFGVPKVMNVGELLIDPAIDVVVNLTPPNTHAEVTLAALRAGKHVYSEKPLATRLEDGCAIMRLAAEKCLRVGCAPDTFMGGALQTCRKAIDSGWIGEPIAATAFMTCRGHESWHPNPEFFYQPGGGPMLDMGPYYLTALVNLIGPIRRVTGMSRITFPERFVTSMPRRGTTIAVKTPTHIAGMLEFAQGAVGLIMTSFDVWKANLPCIEIYGTDGTLSVPDPNCFGGTVSVWRRCWNDWHTVPLTHGHTENSRGMGVIDMVDAIATGRIHRANGTMACHVLEVMGALELSQCEQRHLEIVSTCDRPAPLPAEAELETRRFACSVDR